MSTEYRRGIPSVAHVEAATRLGLEWHRQGCTDTHRTVFLVRVPTAVAVAQRMLNPDGVILSDYGLHPEQLNRTLNVGPTSGWEQRQSYRPIRPDGTPVDWEVLDQEVARAGQRGQPATVTPTASATPTTQPQGFRADLWARVSRHFSLVFRSHNQVSSLTEISNIDDVGIHSPNWQWGWATADREAPTRQNRADILARWTVYQELKPLYDLIDDCPVGRTVSLPVDVFQEWARGSHSESVREIQDALTRDPEWVASRLSLSSHFRRNIQLRGPYCSWYSDGGSLHCGGGLLSRMLRDDFPIEHVATDAQAQKLSNFAAVLDAVAERRVAEQHQAQAPTVTAAQPAQPEPRRFADVRPDRHGWRWWHLFGSDCGARGTLIEVSPVHGWRVKDDPDADWHLRGHYNSAVDGIRTVIPTDEQGNPVSWESIGQGLSGNSIDAVLIDDALGPISPTQPTPLPRFTADELDDVDHSATTTQDSAILKRGKLPTVEAIGKYREVMAKRNGTVTEAVKASGIDCEVAQYVLERWAGGLSDREAEIICDEAYGAVSFTRADIAKCLSHWFAIIRTLDTSEPADTAAQRQRAEAAERQARMAALQAQLAKERAARVAEPIEELSRFALLEVDEAADPSKSIEAWKAQRAALKRASVVRPVPAPQPTPPPRRKAFEVVDAQADGLSGGAAFAVLLSRAMNQNC